MSTNENTKQGGSMHHSQHRSIQLHAMRHRLLPVLSSVVALAGIVVSQAACSIGTKVIKWMEEVQLSTGQVIVVERETRHVPGGGEIFRSSGWRPQQYVIRFKYPVGSERVIEWQSTKMDTEGGYQPEFPLVLNVEPTKNAPYVVTINWLKGFCFEYVRYTYANGIWSEDPLPSEFEPYSTNLYLPAATLDIVKNVSLQLKHTENADGRYRKRLKQVGPKQTDCGA